MQGIIDLLLINFTGKIILSQVGFFLKIGGYKLKQNKVKKLLTLILVVGTILTLTSCSSGSTSESSNSTKTVVDIQGKKVKIPKKVTRIADLWHANNQIVLLLGRSNDLVATTPMVQKNYWYNLVDPKIKKVSAPFAGDELQGEELLKTKPDVVITSDLAQAKIANKAKLPVVNAMFQNFAGLKKSVNLTANILGGSAPKIAKKYNNELNGNINLVKRKLKKVKTKPSVVHFLNPTDLTQVDGKKTIIDEWIKLAGGKNAITKTGNKVSITAEELVKANPDIIIVGQSSTQDARKALKANKSLRNLTAVKQNHVYGNPQGTFPWDRYSAEEALQVLWAAKLLHPEEMKDINLVQKVQNFYHTYYHYQLSTKQAQAILAGKSHI